MDIHILKREPNFLRFLISDIDVSLVNSLRRIMIAEVPTMAIEDVIIIENSSTMKDEILAHRLGLVPLKTDLDSYVLPDECTCQSELGCNKCSVTLTLESETKDEIHTVYSKELKTYDPEIVPVSGEIPLVKLARGQRIRLEAYARLGRGQDHAKWQPVASCTHKYAPIIHIDLEKCNLCNNCVEACLNQVLVMNDTLKVIDVESCNLCRECMRLCPQDAIRIENRKDTFIITIESTGALLPERIFLESNKILQDKTEAFTTLMTQIKKGETG